MKTRRMFLVALCGVAMLIGASSCKKEKQENENGETMTIKASLGSAGNNSKTHLDGGTVKWDMGDAFKLFPAEGTAGTKFSLTRIDEQDGKVAYFEGKHPGGEHFYACYPFNKVSCTTARTFTFSIPQLQNGSPETVSDNTNAGPMVGYMENVSGSLTFQNAMSWLKVGLKGNVVIKRVVLTDNTLSPANNKLNGTLTVTCSVDEGGVFSFTSEMDRNTGTNQLVIVSNDGVQLDGTNPTYFWFQVPAGSLASLNLSAYLDVEGTKNVLNLNKTITHGESVPGIGVNTILTANVNSPVIEGALPGLFTVGVDAEGNPRKVYFSKGNLQYIGSAPIPYWKFADSQEEYFGATQSGDSETINRDLFGWGDLTGHNTSGDYRVDYSWTDDWGSLMGDGWRTLTMGCTESANKLSGSGEWDYLINTREVNGGTGIGHTCVLTTINGVCGLLIFHDDYTGSTTGITAIPDGCVFLPAAGDRTFEGSSDTTPYTKVQHLGERGYYWSSTLFKVGFYSANVLSFLNTGTLSFTHGVFSQGFSVRLVKDVPNASNGGSANDFESGNW